MVSLGICRNFGEWKSSTVNKVDLSKGMQNEPPRNQAFWYPDIPGAHLDLNEKSYTGKPSSTLCCSPRIWVSFGGDNGADLAKLTGIAVTSWLGYISRFEFTYTDPGMKCSLGRQEHINIHDIPADTTFNIDGPGGERIDSVHVNEGTGFSELMVSSVPCLSGSV